MKKLLLFLLVFYTILSFGQGKMYFKNGFHKTKIPFEYHQKLIIIPIVVNGVELNFILDTGASKTVIFSLEDIGDISFNDTELFTVRGIGDGEALDAILSKNNTLSIGDKIIGLNQYIYIVSEYKIDLSSKIGKTIHGIIGYDLIKHFIVNINYQNKVIKIYDHHFFKPPKSKRFEKFDLEINNNKPYVIGTMRDENFGEKKVKLLIDSGNSDAFWLFDDPSTGFIAPEPNFVDHLGVGLSGNIYGKRSIISEFQLGKFTLKKPTVAFLDSTQTHFARLFESRNGSIGNKVLDRFNAYYDLDNGKLWLKKTKHFKDDFKYNKAGLEISYAGKTIVKSKVYSSDNFGSRSNDNSGDKIIIDQRYEYKFRPIFSIFNIRKNSPGDLAGIIEGDIISKINKKDATNLELEEVLNYFYGDHGDTIDLEIYRNGVIHKFRLKLVDPFTSP